MATNSMSAPKRKSERLTPDEKKKLRAYVASFPSIVQAADAMGLTRNVLNRVLIVFSGAPSNISLIREKIGTAA